MRYLNRSAAASAIHISILKKINSFAMAAPQSMKNMAGQMVNLLFILPSYRGAVVKCLFF
jgi:hypothetical protein